MGVEWKCVCKDCGNEFLYSNTKYEAGLVRGWSRPERCEKCRAHHSREINSIGQPFYKVKSLRPILHSKELTSDLGRFNRADRPHERQEIPTWNLDPEKFGIKDDRLIELFHFFKFDPGLQVIVVVGPTGSGKSTYFPYRLVEIPTSYLNKQGEVCDRYWTVPIDTDEDLERAREEVKHTQLVKGLYRHYCSKPDDPRAVEHKVADIDPKIFWRYGQIVVTQPRIQATRNIPDFIAKAMMGCGLGAGHDVGFRHSGSPNSDWNSKLAFVTDGTLITWLAKGELDKINTIMIDEAHERSLNIDIIIGMLTQLLPRYPRLKLIIASATISSDKFINHFNNHLPQRVDANGNVLPNCRIMEFEGKSFKVSPHFRRTDEEPLGYYRSPVKSSTPGAPDSWEGLYKEPKEAYLPVAKKAVEILHAMYDYSPDGGYLQVEEQDESGNIVRDKIDITERQGDILCFLQGEVPIQNCCAEVIKYADEDSILKDLRQKEDDAERLTLQALPLYTTLEQEKQDEALKERPQAHGKLADEILALLLKMADGGEKQGDVIAILNNAGQIHNLCADLDRRIVNDTISIGEKDSAKEFPNTLKNLNKKIVFIPWFTTETAVQLFGQASERSKFNLPPSSNEVIRVVVSTSRNSSKLNRADFPHYIELPPGERRVVVSTNVAETSLTIHGILHVVDCGLINQNKWDVATETASVTAILQSRAGCKQRWGRAGRLQAGDAWLLYTQAQFGKEQEEDEKNPSPDRCFDFYSKPEIMRSPLEQVLLTAKKAGVDSLDPDDFPWLDPPNSAELARSKRSLTLKGALDPDGDLTERGVELGNMRMDAKVASMIVAADKFACALETSVVISFAQKGLKKLFVYNNNWDEPTKKEIYRRQSVMIVGCQDDIELALKLSACWNEVKEAGQCFVKSLLIGVKEDDSIFQNLEKDIQLSVKKLLQASQHEREKNLKSALDQIEDREIRRTVRLEIEDRLKTEEQFKRYGNLFRAVQHSWAFRPVWKETLDSFDDLSKSDFIELKKFLLDISSPEKTSNFKSFVKKARLVSSKNFGLFQQCLEKLPLALATSWARSGYLDPQFFIDAATDQRTILEPLEAHKKGVEERTLDLSRIDRLRVLFALSLPDNIYSKNESGFYEPVSHRENAPELEIHIDDRSICALDPPALFACLERRAGKTAEGRNQTLYVSFIVKYPEDWRSFIASQDRPLHEMTSSELVKIISEHCVKCPKVQTRLTFEQLFPKEAICEVELEELLEDGRWKVKTKTPKQWPLPVQEKFRDDKEDDKESALTDEKESLLVTEDSKQDNALLGKAAREIDEKADKDSSSPEFEIQPNDYEDLYIAEELCEEDAENPLNAIQEKNDDVNTWNWTDIHGILTTGDKSLKPKQVISAEVVSFAGFTQNDSAQILLTYPPTQQQVERFEKQESFSKSDFLWDRKYKMTALRIEALPNVGEYVLVARENQSGCEVLFSSRDLSFCQCGLVPKLVFDNLPDNKQFEARLVSMNLLTKCVRMTTHHVFEESQTIWNELEAKQKVVTLQESGERQFVLLDCLRHLLKRGFVGAAQLAKGRKTERFSDTQELVQICCPSQVRTQWPRGFNMPEYFVQKGKTNDDFSLKEHVDWSTFEEWGREILSHSETLDATLCLEALYDLYERSRRLTAIDKLEYKRIESLVNKEINATIVRVVSAAGAELSTTKDDFEFKLWLPISEYTWYADETLDALQEGEFLKVKVIDIDWGNLQFSCSRKALISNPYLNYKVGQAVNCVSRGTTKGGLRISIDRLSGFISDRDLAWLPDEGDVHEEGRCFKAVITSIDEVKGRIQLERCSIVFKRLFGECGFVEVRNSKSYEPNNKHRNDAIVLRGVIKEVKESGVEIQIALGLKGWAPVGELPRNHSYKVDDNVDFVLLPADMQNGGNIKVSVRRTECLQYFTLGNENRGRVIGVQGANIRAIEEKYPNSKIYTSKDRSGSGNIVSSDVNSFNGIKRAFEEHVANCGCSLKWESATPKRRGPNRLDDILKPTRTIASHNKKSSFPNNLPTIDKDFQNFPSKITRNVVDNSSIARKSNEVDISLVQVTTTIILVVLFSLALLAVILLPFLDAIPEDLYRQNDVNVKKLADDAAALKRKELEEESKKDAQMTGETSVDGLTSKWAPSSSRKAGYCQTLKIGNVECGFCWIPAGEFDMGSPTSEFGRYVDETLHHVKLTDGGWMLETEVTQALYQEVMKTNPSYFKGNDLPVEQVSWYDAMKFCAELTKRLPAGMKASLPTEAQWEYACRAGTTTAFSYGYFADSDKMNYHNNVGQTKPVKSYSANAWGLYDMHGNVGEWCLDFYGKDYPTGTVVDPKGPNRGSDHVIRGGNWNGNVEGCRSAFRISHSSEYQIFILGFRCFLSIETGIEPEESAEEVVDSFVSTDGVEVKERPSAVEVAASSGLDEWRESSERKAGYCQTLKIGSHEYGFCWIPAGEFDMGSPTSEFGRYVSETPHHVKLTKGFWMLETEVTQALYQEIMKTNPSEFKGYNLPVEKVSWFDAMEFCEKLTKRLPSGMKASLPTEAQWEYSCKAGTKTPFSFGSVLNGDKANCDGTIPYGTETEGKYVEQTTPVKNYSPNAWGLYDMHGNIREWCLDYYGHYQRGTVVDPKGPNSDSLRVNRGGSWYSVARSCRSACRSRDTADNRSNSLGFRCLLSCD